MHISNKSKLSNSPDMSQKKKENILKNYALRIALNTASHPVEYAKILIQIGHEPIAPQPTTTLFGKPALKLPNVFTYIKHIKSVDGFAGCYRGLVPKLCGNVASVVACQTVLDKLQLDAADDEENSDEQRLTEYELFIRSLKKDVISRFTAILVSQPFHVVTIRMMAQFVGGEDKYVGIIGSALEIYKENGVVGFFSGLAPRILGDIISILLANTLAYAVNTYIVDEPDMKMYSTATISFIASALTYPFQVVSNCMAISGSGLAASAPPYMPHYTSWIDCWSNLTERNQLRRGSSLLIRYYTGPQVIIDGKALSVNKDQVYKFKY